MELSARVPTRGSCYAFTYHSLGELPAVIGAVCLTLEYGLSGAGVARNWSSKLASLLNKYHVSKYFFFPYDGSTGGDIDDGSDDDVYFDIPAGFLQLLCVIICVIGLRLGKVVINSFTTAKCLLVVFMIIVGFSAWRVNVFSSQDEFFPQGMEGTLKGTSLLFFGFIGFDEVCCLASRSEDPAHTMPRAIAGTLLGATILSVLAQLALGGMVERGNDDDSTTSFEEAFGDVGWGWAKWITSVGEVLLLPLVVLVSFLPQPELFAALAEDGVIPISFAKENKQGTLVYGTLVGGFIMVVCSCLVPFVVLWDMINLGVLLGFNLTNTSLIIMRYGIAGDNSANNAPSRISCDESKAVEHEYLSSNGRPMTEKLIDRSGSSRHTKQVRQCVFMIWVMGAMGAYCFWNGFADPRFEDKPVNTPLFILGLSGLMLYALSLFWLSTRCVMEVEKLPITTFRAFGVPIIPSFAILCNFFLMAQYDAWTHAYLGFFIAASLIGYIWYRFSKY
mmetsp:Transcript_1805/g.2305  ORF Transcript_1805/g.2305 Transcript_1805/m.2305 type:complete len:504 (-) Transcript_1805:118-1629(-)